MFYLLVVLVAIVTAVLRGGRPVENLRMQYPWLALCALALQLFSWLSPTQWEDVPFTAISYTLLAVFVWLNLHVQGLRVLMMGLALNILVIALNGGRMPVDLQAALSAGVDPSTLIAGTEAKQQLMTPDSILPILGDVIPVPLGPLSRVLSLGDLFVLVGTFLLVHEMLPPRPRALGPEEATS